MFWLEKSCQLFVELGKWCYAVLSHEKFHDKDKPLRIHLVLGSLELEYDMCVLCFEVHWSF